MKDPKEPKVPLPVKVPKSLYDEIDTEAKEKGVPRTEIVEYRLKHYPIPLTPELMVKLQDEANKKYEDLKPDMPKEAIRIQKEVMKLWKLLK